jgi:hypothetical protein
MALRKRFPNSLRRSALTFLYSPETPPCQRIRATMQDRKLVDRDGMIERVQTRQADYLRCPTRIAWNLTPGISPQPDPFRALPEANFTFRPEFIDHSLNPLDVFGAGEGGSTQLYPLAEFELVISGTRFVYDWQSLGHCIQKET